MPALHKTKISESPKAARALPWPHWRFWAGIAISSHFVLILLVGLSHHWGHMSSLNDLGVFDQAVWGTLNGDPFLNTSNLFSKPINWLGFHFNLILLAFVPLYAIAPAPEWLTAAQALAISSAAWPIFILASRVCRSEKVGLLWALAYLFNPFVLNAAAWDFHPVTLAVPFIALGMLAIEKTDSRMLIWSCVPMLLIQEHLGVTVAGLGLLWGLHNGRWRPAAWLFLLGLVDTILVFGFVMPALSPVGNHLMLEGGTGQLSRYSWLGHSVPEVMHTLVTHPFAVMKIVLSDFGGATYLMLLLLPLLGLPLAAPSFLLPGVADLAANVLSANPLPRGIFSYHSVTLAAILTVGAVYGSQRLSLWIRRLSLAESASLALLGCLLSGYFLAPLPLPMAWNVWQPINFPRWPDQDIGNIRSIVGNSASVSAQANIGAHFSQRREIYVYPNQVDRTKVIVLNLESPTKRLVPFEEEKPTTLAFHLQMNPDDYLESINRLLSGKEYGVLLWDYPWLVMARDRESDPAQVRQIRFKIQQLRKGWAKQ